MKAGIYCRISLDAQGQGLGVARQEQACRDKAKALGWTVVEVYTDNDVSAYSGKERPRYEAMLADLASGVIDAVVVYDLDRLTRRVVELVRFMDWQKTHGFELANVSGDVDLTTANGRMIATIKGAVAQQEAERTGERIKFQKAQRAAAGKKQGGRYRVYGYTRDWQVVPDEAAVVKEAFKRRAAGESATAIAADLSSRGLRTVAKNQWTANSLIKLLTKTEYAGLLSSNGVVVGKTAFKPLVDEATFNAAQTQLASTKRGTNARAHLLSGILVCSKCLATMKGNAGAGRPSYRCPSPKSVPTACGSTTIKLGPTDEAVFNAAWRKWQDAPVVREDTRDFDAEVAVIDQRITEARNAFTSGQTNMVDTQAMLQSLNAQRASVLAEQASQPVDLDVLAPMADWETMNLSQKRLWITSQVEYVLVHPSTQGARAGYDIRRLEVFFVDGTRQRLTKGVVVDSVNVSDNAS